MNCFNSLLSEDAAAAGAVAEAGVGARDTTEVGVGVPLSSIRATPVGSSSPAGGEFQQGLRRVQSPAIALAG